MNASPIGALTSSQSRSTSQDLCSFPVAGDQSSELGFAGINSGGDKQAELGLGLPANVERRSLAPPYTLGHFKGRFRRTPEKQRLLGILQFTPHCRQV